MIGQDILAYHLLYTPAWSTVAWEKSMRKICTNTGHVPQIT